MAQATHTTHAHEDAERKADAKPAERVEAKPVAVAPFELRWNCVPGAQTLQWKVPDGPWTDVPYVDAS